MKQDRARGVMFQRQEACDSMCDRPGAKCNALRAAVVAVAVAMVGWTVPAWAQNATAGSVTAESVGVATLPPAGPHRVFVLGGFSSAGGATVVEADDPHIKVVGLVPVARGGLMALSSDAGRIYVVETFYSHGNRGTREDVLSVYDGMSLNLLREITVPGRLLTVPQPHLFEISPDAHLAYIYDLFPSSRVHVIDLDASRVLASVDLPGCSLAIPYSSTKFATICGDGTVSAIDIAQAGDPRTAVSKPFFDANHDPVFESSCLDSRTNTAWFLTYSGQIVPVSLGDKAPLVGAGWSINVAAGLPRAGTGEQELAWRPGGRGQVMVLNRASKRLYVLMHTGDYWTHKQPGTEIWVLDPEDHRLERRISLKAPARGIAVSQDTSPLLYALGDDDEFAVLDATSGEQLRSRKLSSSLAWTPQG